MYFIEHGKRLNSQYYQQILEGSLVTKAQYLSLKLVIFMQNRASCHSSESTINFLNEKDIQVLLQWPPQSPDLNHTENVWKLLKDKIDTSAVSSHQILFSKIKEQCDALSQSEIQNLIMSIPKRIDCVIGAKGGHTKY